jgi:serine/threonine protein kinase
MSRGRTSYYSELLKDMKIELKIGDIELMEVLAQGSTGVVWRGIHRIFECPVAVKMLNAASAGSMAMRGELQRDIEIMAMLSHPGITSVVDFGVITEKDASRFNPPLLAGSPVLAMEVASSSCSDLEHISCWTSLRGLLLQLLDVLGYIHSRGIIHCDVKPDNILRFPLLPSHRDDPNRWTYKLTDFGIAHYWDRSDRPNRTAHSREGPASSASPIDESGPDHQENIYCGSPEYSAPEQILGDRHHFGPWTDLYAVGCLAYECATGAPPFVEQNFIKLTMRHLNEKPAPINSRFAVPPGFNDWVQRLLEKEPARRYRHAVHAAAALRALPSPFTHIGARINPRRASGPMHPLG